MPNIAEVPKPYSSNQQFRVHTPQYMANTYVQNSQSSCQQTYHAQPTIQHPYFQVNPQQNLSAYQYALQYQVAKLQTSLQQYTTVPQKPKSHPRLYFSPLLTS